MTHKCDCFFTTGMKLVVDKYDDCGLFIVFWFKYTCHFMCQLVLKYQNFVIIKNIIIVKIDCWLNGLLIKQTFKC